MVYKLHNDSSFQISTGHYTRMHYKFIHKMILQSLYGHISGIHSIECWLCKPKLQENFYHFYTQLSEEVVYYIFSSRIFTELALLPLYQVVTKAAVSPEGVSHKKFYCIHLISTMSSKGIIITTQSIIFIFQLTCYVGLPKNKLDWPMLSGKIHASDTHSGPFDAALHCKHDNANLVTPPGEFLPPIANL